MISNRVHITVCKEYEDAIVRKSIEEAVEAVGGLPVKNGDVVLLKPNLLTAKSPERAVTTHPAIVKAVAGMVIDCGGKPVIGDSPSGSPGEEIFGVTGIKEAASILDIPIENFSSTGTIENIVRGNAYYLARQAVECDLLINLPKLKTHSLTLFTGAVKNLYGCLSGFQKGNWHRRAPKADDFSQIVVDVFSCFQPVINIMDGILAMEGDGPSNGSPKHVGIILASNNAPALDRIASRIIGYDPEEIYTTRFAELRGFTQGEKSLILSGKSIDEVKPSAFSLPVDRYLRMIPELAHEVLGKFIWTRPKVNPEMCTECYACVGNCPVNAMTENGGPPDIDYKTCINCYCCDEVCPAGAIDKKMSWLAKRLT